MINKRFINYAWLMLVVTLIVILWGDVVQATGSGDGCGAHWPVCNGEVLPAFEGKETMIEFVHRLTSGMVFLMAAGLLVWAWRAYPKGSGVRQGANFTMLFMITESLVGAGLVLFRLVGENSSMARAFVAPIHLLNTLLLIGAVILTLYFAYGGKRFSWKGQGRAAWLLSGGLLAIVLLSTTGAITSLGDAIFPVANTAEAVSRSLSPSEHFLVRLRIWHPFIAIAVGTYLLIAAQLVVRQKASSLTRNLALAVSMVYLLQLVIGVLNVALSAILPTQLIHLLMADSLWMLWVLLTASALAMPALAAQQNFGVARGLSGTD
ncbi:MAG: COX15/CtaA family protein [Trueperaceae bacterium]|nr:COX15/CtaA family protein [Trueperaceae bacterium]